MNNRKINPFCALAAKLSGGAALTPESGRVYHMRPEDSFNLTEKKFKKIDFKLDGSLKMV